MSSLLMPGGAAQAASNGTVSGTVTALGAAMSYGNVDAVPVAAPDSYPTSATILDSHYSLSLPPGNYLLKITGTSDTALLAPEWWNDSTTRAGATPVTVVSGGHVIANADLGEAGSISGYVDTDAKNTGLEDTSVVAYQQDSSYPGGWVPRSSATASSEAADGKYTVRNLPSGTYRLHFYSQYTHREGWWPNAGSLADATSIVLTAPNAVTGIDPQLGTAPVISGTVTLSATGAAAADVQVALYENDRGAWQFTNSYTTTAADGTYSFWAPAGTYRVKFSKAGSVLRTEYWNNHTSISTASDVTLTVGSTRTGINAAMEQFFKLSTMAKITGTYKVGYTLKAVKPTSTPSPTSTSYQWLRDGKAITGTAARYSYWKLVSADRHHKIGVKITIRRSGYVSLARTVTKSTLP